MRVCVCVFCFSFQTHFLKQFVVHFYSILAPFWLHFGSILAPFWDHCGSMLPLWRGPGRRGPKCPPHSLILASLWAPRGSPFPLKILTFFGQKMHRFWDRFWEAFWRVSGAPDPPKLSSRLSETLIFRKSPFSPWNRFWMENGGESGAIMMPEGL